MSVEAQWGAGRAAARVVRSQAAGSLLRARMDGWFSDRRADERFGRFGTHFDVLQTVLRRMLCRVDRALATIRTEADPLRGSVDAGRTYQRCTDLDRRTSLVGRIFDWYAAKYDQRLDDELAGILLAADEVVRSCWTQPFTAARLPRPTGPLVFVDPRFDAAATPRTSVPPDLRAPSDALVGDVVAQLAIPVVALPAVAVAEPWWLALAAHETGHHVQLDLSAALVADTRAAMLAAATAPPGDPELAAFWPGWAWEAFADAFAVLTIGPAAAWVVEELQHGPPAALTRPPRPGDRYPPPVVRTALLGELARLAGAERPGPGAGDVRTWLDAVGIPAADTVRGLLAVTPAVAAALVDLRVDHVDLRTLCGWRADLDRNVAAWSRELVKERPVITGRSSPEAARIGVAAAVRAYETRDTPERPAALARNVPAVLRTCGPPGTLAGEPVPDADALADRLADLLLPLPDGPA